MRIGFIVPVILVLTLQSHARIAPTVSGIAVSCQTADSEKDNSGNG